MAQQHTIDTVIVLRNDQTTNWETSNHVMLPGEVGIGYLANGNVIAKLGDGEHSWKDLPQIEGVFEDNITLTHNFGRHKTVNGSVNAGGAGMTTSQWLIDALAETLAPKTNYPDASLAVPTNPYTTDTGTNEIGSKITAIKWSTATDLGSYTSNDDPSVTYGTSGGDSSASGLDYDDFTWLVSNETDSQTSNAASGTFSFTSDKWIQIDSTSKKTYALLNGSVTLDPSGAYTPKDNLGNSYADGRIAGFDKDGTTTLNFTDIAVQATGYRDTWYYVGTDCTTAIDSNFIRAATSKKSNTTSFGTVTIPAGTKRVMFAVLGDKTLKSVIDVDGQGLDVKANFTKETIAVNGANGYTAANYSVFHFENENGIAATKYTVTIG